MADFWISFRVDYDSKHSYDRRYEALNEAIEQVATGGLWDAQTSFLAIRSKYGIDTITKHLKKPLNASDHLVIREIGKVNTRYINDPGDGFDAFFPEAKKV